mmetsp:Transcript_132498/g.247804  ORF Transcript_132498/g.247804 Transcript_132498/m.247804 type:complete len:517 (+) Transcript_132498:81-1631(+)
MGDVHSQPGGPGGHAAEMFSMPKVGKTGVKTRSIKMFEQKQGREITDRDLKDMHQQASTFLQKYEMGRRLNSGAQGVTYLATDRKTRNVVVVKKPNDPNDLEDYNLLITKTHPNIVRVFEYFHNPLETYIVMECCSGGDLFGAMESLGMPTQNWCAAVFVQICRGANYIHAQFNEAHCDLKPENILLDRKPKHVRDIPRAMVGDFGCLAPINTIGAPSGGDPRYRAYEIWEGYTYSSCSDVWALGITLYELVTGGLLPYVDKPNISGWMNFASADNGQLWAVYQQCISSGVNPQFPLLAKFRRITDLLGKMIQADFMNRITLPEALNHPWFELGSVGAKEEHLSEQAVNRFAKRARGQRLYMTLLDSLARILQGESLTYYRRIWDQYDDDEDGVMTADEFREMMEEEGLAQQSRTIGGPDAVFQMGDRDNSGTISFHEFVALIFDPDKLTVDEKMKYFNTLFMDISGGASQITFPQFMKLFPGIPLQEVQYLFREIDTNKSGMIDTKEFQDYLSKS